MLLKVQALAALVIPIYALVTIWLRRKRSWPWSRLILLTLLVVYGLSVARVTLFPVPLLPGMSEQFGSLSQIFGLIRLWPDWELIAHGSAAQVLGNIALGIPLGFVAPLCWRLRPERVALLGLITAVAIECAQLLISLAVGWPYRTVDSTDVLLNTLGVVAGYVLLKVAMPVVRIALAPNDDKRDSYLATALEFVSSGDVGDEIRPYDDGHGVHPLEVPERSHVS